MTCHDENIKDLLPAYREQVLDQLELDRVRIHLESCEDCRTELALLGLLAEESVPDPGEAYWAALPERVHRAVLEAEKSKGHFNLFQILGRFTLPRWAWIAAATGVVLLVSWIAFLAPQKSPDHALSPAYELSDEIVAADPTHISELDQDELDAVASWAGNELASISREIESGMLNWSDTNLYEELRQLNAREVERLSTMIDQWRQEG